MTPALAIELVLVCEVMWAATPPPADTVCDRKWNWSAVPAISFPPPLIVHVPVVVASDSLPAGVALPTSAELHPAEESSVHITRTGLDWKLPTVVTLAATTSSPSEP